MATTSARILLAATALLFVTALAPAATAQVQPGLDFQLGAAPTAPIKPVLESAPLDLTYQYDLKLAPLQVLGLIGSVKLEFTIACTPNEVTISGDTSVLIPITAASTTGASDAIYSEVLHVAVSPKRSAPGLEKITCDVSATATALQSAAVPAAASGHKNFEFTAGVYSLIDYSVDLPLQQGGPQTEVPYTININNFGNARTRIQYNLVGDQASGWTVIPPQPLVVDSATGTTPRGTSTFTVSTPHKNGWNNDQASFTLKLAPEAADDNTIKGSEGQVTLVTRVRGVYVPTLEPFTMVAAVLGSALVLRMRRADEEL